MLRKYFKWLRDDFFGSAAVSDYDRIVNHPYAKAATPDDLIAAYCVERIAKDFDSWKLPLIFCDFNTYELKYEKDDKKIVVTFTYYMRYRNGKWTYVHDEASVNGQTINAKSSELIVASYMKIREARRKVEAEAAAAKRQMEENEKKWNLAENLLGMKRLANGALVPKDYEEPKELTGLDFENKFDPCLLSCCVEREKGI